MCEEVSGAIAEAESKTEETRVSSNRSGGLPGANIPRKKGCALYWKDFVTRYRFAIYAGEKVSGQTCIMLG